MGRLRRTKAKMPVLEVPLPGEADTGEKTLS